jgi:hypothetical protein
VAAPAGADDEDDASLPDIPRHGLSLAALRRFVAAHATERLYDVHTDTGARVALPFEALTTAQVVEGVVKPATAHAGKGGAACTYAQLLLQAQEQEAQEQEPQDWPASDGTDAVPRAPLVAAATHFVSHAWAFPFADLVAALAARDAAGADAGADAHAHTAYFWLGASCHACGAVTPLRSRAR